jgi:hypothetical protein
MREGSLQVCRSADRDTAYHRLLYQEKKKVSVEVPLDQFFKEVDKMLSTVMFCQR